VRPADLSTVGGQIGCAATVAINLRAELLRWRFLGNSAVVPDGMKLS